MTDPPDIPRRLDDMGTEEPWHGHMFLSSLVTGAFGIAAIVNGDPGLIVLGVLIFVLIIAAGCLSHFWITVDHLDPVPKMVIWTAAIPGGAVAIAVLWRLKFIHDVSSHR
jgi:hypothetical protein